MITILDVEIRKLNGSLAALLALATPALPGGLACLSLMTSDRTSSWTSIFNEFLLPIWALFLLPMIVAAFTTLVSQIEHRGRSWDHLLALPIRRWQVFLAKAIVVLVTSGCITLLALLNTGIGAWLGGTLGGHVPVGAIPWQSLARTMFLLWSGTTLMIVLQLWSALRFASFVVSLSVGIGGTLVALAVAMTHTQQAAWFPWVLPMKIVTSKAPVPFALAGGIAGVILLAVMVIDLTRRDFR
ncbi:MULTISPECIES: ABC transporter permease [unclassified Sphingomonas]|uniref:ABC transporter permease n=1 Tax=Sphingomonas sp. PvP015 TaxID=3156388 RepID=UPI0033954580